MTSWSAADDNDTLNGGDDDDYLRGGEGNDVIDGGGGFDRAAFTVLVNNPAIGETGVQTGATVDLNIQGVAQDTGHGMDTLIGIEHVSGTAYADTLIGNGGDNWIWGEGGDDDTAAAAAATTWSRPTPAIPCSTAARAVIRRASKASTASPSGVTVSLALQGSAQTVAAGSNITLSNFENLTGTTHDDTLTGDGGDNVLAGDAGNDTLTGGAGAAIHSWATARSCLDTHGTGFSGPIATLTDATRDLSRLTPGNDVLDGGAGDDILNGGGGIDTASFAVVDRTGLRQPRQ